MPDAVKNAFAFSFLVIMISPSFTEAWPEVSGLLCGTFDVPLSKDPRTEPPTDVAGSEALLGIVPGESIVSADAIVSLHDQLRGKLRAMMPSDFQHWFQTQHIVSEGPISKNKTQRKRRAIRRAVTRRRLALLI